MAKRHQSREIEKIYEIGRTVRFSCVCVVVSIGLVLVYKAIIRYWELHQDPPWLTVVLTVLGSLAPPAIIIRIFWKRIQKFTATVLQRNRKLEHDADSKRSSCGLKEDGTNEPEDKI